MVTLYKYFASIGKIDSGPVHNFPSLVDDEKCMRDVTVTESDVLRAICKMKANASSGPDGLPPVLFKKLKHSLTTPLTPSIHPCLFLRKKSNQKYGTYISTIKNPSGATRHSSVLITTPLK